MELTDFETKLAELNLCIECEGASALLMMERGKLYHKAGVNDKALNDFLKVVELDPTNREAREYVKMLRDIFAFRYMDYYNP
jgi:lipoprotein NlpI